MEPFINADIELPAIIQNPGLQETEDINEQVTGTTEMMMHGPVLCAEKSLTESFKKKETLYVSLETEMLFTDLTSTEIDVECMQDKSGSFNVIEDIPIFMCDDSKPENY